MARTEVILAGSGGREITRWEYREDFWDSGMFWFLVWVLVMWAHSLGGQPLAA